MEPQMNADERRLKTQFSASAFVRVHLRFLLLAALFAGCASDKQPTTRPSSMRERQDAALRDPMGYSPDMDSPDTDISGGKLHELNRGAIKKDIDHVFNP